MADYKRADDIAFLQNELTYYKPGDFIVLNKSPALPSQIRCAVFGHTGVGKSSFINSIFYALTNRWDAPAKGGTSDDVASITPRWEPINVARNIVFYNNRGTANVNADYLREAERQKRGRVKEDRVDWTPASYWDGVRKSLETHASNFTMTGPNNTEMHCVVIVVSAVSIMAGMRADVWSDLIDRVEDISGYTPMFVITHHFVAGDHGKPLARRFKAVLGDLRIDEDDIFCVENYRRDSHSRDDKKHLQFLNILRRIVVNGEKAIHKEHRPPSRVHYRRQSDQRSRVVDRVPSDQRSQSVPMVPSDQLSQVYGAPAQHLYHQSSNHTQKSRTCIII